MSSDKDLYDPALETFPDYTNEEMAVVLGAWLKLVVTSQTTDEIMMARHGYTMAQRFVSMVAKLKRRLGESTTYTRAGLDAILSRAEKMAKAEREGTALDAIATAPAPKGVH